jgi:glucose/mannose-6-phosphate isomerase
MILDDLEGMRRIDQHNMLAEIESLPEQLRAAWDLGQSQQMPVAESTTFARIVIAGMGGSAIGADLLAALAAPTATIPIIVHRDYGLPGFASGADTLFIASSHSGSTEETLDSFETAFQRGCTVMSMATGGELVERARQTRTPMWLFEHRGQPRAAVGYSFGLLLALFARLHVIPDPAADLLEAVQAMQRVREANGPRIPAAQNPAKRYAGQLMGRWTTVFGAGIMAPVARRLKTQLNELAKAGAQFEFIPEADHNALAGTTHPEEVLMPHTMSLFVRSPSDHPRNRRRLDLTKQAYMLEGLNTDFLDARGRSALANMWTTILFGDYMAFYLAMAYGVDPTPVAALQSLKQAMRPAE